MPPPSANRSDRCGRAVPGAPVHRGASVRLLHRRTLAAALLLMLPAAGHCAEADSDSAAAHRTAHDHHRQAVAACRLAADPAACRREADAELAVDLRQVQPLPAAGATQRHRQRQQRLLRELEQAAPRPQPPPGPTPSERPTPGRSLDR